MTSEQTYIEVAQAELLNPTLETTKQHLEVMQSLDEDGLPKVARVDHDLTDELVAVYFFVKEERFFMVVNVTKTKPHETQGFWIQTGNRVYLTATSESLNFQELANLLTVEPLTGWSKGEPRPNGKTNHSFSRISFEPNDNEAFELEDKLKELLTHIEADREGVQALTEKASALVSVCKHQYVSANAGIHLDTETIGRLNDLKLAIDVDTYIVGNELKN